MRLCACCRVAGAGSISSAVAASAAAAVSPAGSQGTPGSTTSADRRAEIPDDARLLFHGADDSEAGSVSPRTAAVVAAVSSGEADPLAPRSPRPSSAAAPADLEEPPSGAVSADSAPPPAAVPIPTSQQNPAEEPDVSDSDSGSEVEPAGSPNRQPDAAPEAAEDVQQSEAAVVPVAAAVSAPDGAPLVHVPPASSPTPVSAPAPAPTDSDSVVAQRPASTAASDSGNTTPRASPDITTGLPSPRPAVASLGAGGAAKAVRAPGGNDLLEKMRNALQMVNTAMSAPVVGRTAK